MLGIVILSNACFAAISIGYAAFMAFRSGTLSLLVAILWGLLFIAIDRLLISTTWKRAMPPGLSFSKRIAFRARDFASAAPRIAIAVLMGLIVAEPVKVRLLEREIQEELAARRQAAVLAVQASVERAFPEIRQLENENARLNRELDEKRSSVTGYLNLMLSEPSGQLSGPVFERRRDLYLQARTDAKRFETTTLKTLSENEQTLSQLRTAARQATERAREAISTRTTIGFLSYLVTLHEVEQRNAAVRTVGVFISLLFITVEIMPLLIRLLANPGPYEFFWDAVETMSLLNGEISRRRIGSMRQQHGTSRKSDMPTTRKLRAFLCHASEDKALVRRLAQRLRQEDVEVWLDDECLLPGQDWQQEIRIAVRSADVVIICMSPRSVNKSGYVQREVRFAVEVAAEQPDGAIFLIPVKIEECVTPPSLDHLHWIALNGDAAYERLVLAIRKRQSQRGLQA